MGRRRRRRRRNYNSLYYKNWYEPPKYRAKPPKYGINPPKYRTKEQLERSEEEWEEWLIKRLVARGWKFRQDLQSSTKRTSEKELEKNLLKNFKLFLKKNNLANSFDFDWDIRDKLLSQLKVFEFKDLSDPINIQVGENQEIEIPLINKENIEQNIFEVAQQVREYRKDKFEHVYDLVLLINGLPLVCIELKTAKRGSKEGFLQLREYEGDRFRTEPRSIFNNFQLFISCNFQNIHYFWKNDLFVWTEANHPIHVFQIKRCKEESLVKLLTINDFFNPANIVKLLHYKRTIVRKPEKINIPYSKLIINNRIDASAKPIKSIYSPVAETYLRNKRLYRESREILRENSVNEEGLPYSTHLGEGGKDFLLIIAGIALFGFILVIILIRLLS